MEIIVELEKQSILQALNDKSIMQHEIVLLYAQLQSSLGISVNSEENNDCREVNVAIIERWGVKALISIKNKALKLAFPE